MPFCYESAPRLRPNPRRTVNPLIDAQALLFLTHNRHRSGVTVEHRGQTSEPNHALLRCRRARVLTQPISATWHRRAASQHASTRGQAHRPPADRMQRGRRPEHARDQHAARGSAAAKNPLRAIPSRPSPPRHEARSCPLWRVNGNELKWRCILYDR
jgi:hypothetical protein